jgi:hypothetical protein
MRAITCFILAAGSATAHGQPAPQPGQPAAPAPDAGAPLAVTASNEDAAKPWTIGIEPRLGVLVPTSKLGTNVMGGVEVDYATPVLDRRLVIALDASFARPSHSGTVMSTQLPAPGDLGYTVQQLEVVLGLTANYRIFDDSHALVPRLGAGPLIHLLKTSETTNPSYSGANNSQQTKVGFELTAGVDYKAGPGFLAGDLRFLYSSLDTPITGGSNAGSLAIAAGYRFVF